MEKWRLLTVEVPNRAAMNLAIEEAIFLEKTKKKIPPTVRFWRNRRAVVVGYSQNVQAEVDLNTCRKEGVEIIRRFSGGGTVYHDMGNLNYTIVLDADHPLLRGLDIVESYKLFSSGVIEGLKKFGIESIFEPPSNLLIRNKKVSGNAQSRKKGVILHHGTLLVDTDLDLLTRVLNASDEQNNKKTTSQKKPVTNLAEEIGRHVNIKRVKEALKQGFEKAFSVELIEGILVPEEEKAAYKLCFEKYSKKEWNFWR